VLAADAGETETLAALASHADLSPRAAILTRIDRSTAPARALELAAARKLAFAFLCDGVDVQQHLHRASADTFADLLLRGRLA